MNAFTYNNDVLLNDYVHWVFPECPDDSLREIKVSSPNKKNKKMEKIQKWAEQHQYRLGEYDIDPNDLKIKDVIGDSIMYIPEYFLGLDESRLIKEITAHLGE